VKAISTDGDYRNAEKVVADFCERDAPGYYLLFSGLYSEI
jgi:hypothetical protein